MLHLHDTATGTKMPLYGADLGRVGLYVCGPTVYGPSHIGHGRHTLTYDILRRYLEWTGVEVQHVSNITDIDDKIIAVANRDHRSQAEVAAEFESQWWAAMDGLGALRPTRVTRATEYINQMIGLIEDLIGKGVAYPTSDGVYLETSQVPGYGLLAQQSLDSLRSGARVEVNEEKRAPIDFALWKLAKPGEPEWEAPFGAGRPGWHTECVVMSLDALGDGFSLHGGGTDLKFPHHENERAQAVAIGRPFARHWMHHEMLNLGGDKMARSVGNVFDLQAFVAENDARAYRLCVLQAHYGTQMEMSPEALGAATRTLRGLDSMARRLAEARAADGTPLPAPASTPAPVAAASEVTERFSRHMDNDLSTPEAMAALFDGLRAANSLFDAGDGVGGAAVGQATLGCFAAVGLQAATEAEVSVEALELARLRDAARADRDWAAADSLRDQIVGLGYRVEDTANGTRVLD